MSMRVDYEDTKWSQVAKKLHLFETCYSLDLIIKENNGEVENQELRKTISDTTKQLHLKNDNKSSKWFVPRLKNVVSKLEAIGEKESEEGKKLHTNCFKYFCSVKSTRTSLKLFFNMSKFTTNEIFTDTYLSNYIIECLERKFADKNPSDRENNLLFDFITKCLTDLSEQESKYPKSLETLKDLMKYLNIIGKQKKTFQLYEKCRKGDSVMKTFLTLVENTADKRFIELVENRTNESKSDEEMFLYMVNQFTASMFRVRSEYPKSYEKVKQAMVKAHLYDIKSMRKALEQEKIFSRK